MIDLRDPFETQYEVQIQAASAGRGRPPGVRDAYAGNVRERGSPVPLACGFDASPGRGGGEGAIPSGGLRVPPVIRLNHSGIHLGMSDLRLKLPFPGCIWKSGMPQLRTFLSCNLYYRVQPVPAILQPTTNGRCYSRKCSCCIYF
jgi:hypothetical protein